MGIRISSTIDYISLLSKSVNSLVKYITIITTVLFLSIVFAGVVSRYILNASLIFSVELSKLLFVWSCFLAATIAYKQKNHIRFDFLNRLFGEKGIALTDLLFYLMSFVFFIVVLVYSISFTKMIWGTTLTVMQVSQGWLYLAVVASSIIFLIHTVDLFINSLKNIFAAFRKS